MEGWIEWYYVNSQSGPLRRETSTARFVARKKKKMGKQWYGKKKYLSTRWSRAPVHQTDAIAAAL